MVLLLTLVASSTAGSRALLATPRQADGGFVVIITMMTNPRTLLNGLVDGLCTLLAAPQQAALSLGCVVRPRTLLATLQQATLSSGLLPTPSSR